MRTVRACTYVYVRVIVGCVVLCIGVALYMFVLFVLHSGLRPMARLSFVRLKLARNDQQNVQDATFILRAFQDCTCTVGQCM